MTKFKEKASKILKITRIFDKEGLISLTNMTMYLVLYKIAMTPSMSMSEITALALGVLGYQAKLAMSK